ALSIGAGDYEWGFVGIVAAIGGVSATPDAAAYQNDASAASMTTPSISPSASNDYLVAIAGVDDFVTISQPAGMTQRATVSDWPGSIAYADQLLTSSGTTGTRSFPISAAFPGSGALLALAPISSSSAMSISISPTSASLAPSATQ